jgi:phosphomannomutase
MVSEIKFGTDGWRGIIADDYTFENVRLVATAVAAHVIKNEHPEKGLVVGYDTRFGSQRFAEAVAEVIAMNHLLRYSGVNSAEAFNERLVGRMQAAAANNIRQYLQEDNE